MRTPRVTPRSGADPRRRSCRTRDWTYRSRRAREHDQGVPRKIDDTSADCVRARPARRVVQPPSVPSGTSTSFEHMFAILPSGPTDRFPAMTVDVPSDIGAVATSHDALLRTIEHLERRAASDSRVCSLTGRWAMSSRMSPAMRTVWRTSPDGRVPASGHRCTRAGIARDADIEAGSGRGVGEIRADLVAGPAAVPRLARRHRRRRGPDSCHLRPGRPGHDGRGAADDPDERGRDPSRRPRSRLYARALAGGASSSGCCPGSVPNITEA